MWDWFINFLTWVLSSLQSFLGDWGLAVIVLTFIIRLLLTPLMTRSAASTARMQLAQPKMQEIQERYADDQQRQAEELRKLYSEIGFNPIGGCLPMFLQMPIFFALFTVAKNVPASASFYGILPSLASSCSQMLAANGIGGAIVYILFDLMFGVLTFIPMLINTSNQPAESRSQSITMGAVMAVMMIWFGWNVPAAVLLYYNVSAIWQVVQQQFITQRIIAKDKAEYEARMADAPIEVDVVRKERKKRPRKKA